MGACAGDRRGRERRWGIQVRGCPDEGADAGISAAGGWELAAATAATAAATTTTAGGTALAPVRPTQADAIGLASKSQSTGGYRLRKDRPGTAGKDRPGTAGWERPGTGGGPGTGTPGASPKTVGNAPLPSAANPHPNPKANASATAIVYPSQPSKDPATFQEMGYHSQKLDEECVIM